MKRKAGCPDFLRSGEGENESLPENLQKETGENGKIRQKSCCDMKSVFAVTVATCIHWAGKQ